MASQDARLSKFEADFKQQQSEMTNNIDTVLKAITNRIIGAHPSNTVKNPELNVNPTSSVLSARSYPTDDPQCSTQIHSSINTISICPKRPGESQTGKPEEEEQDEKDNPENINTNPSSPPDPSISFITEKVPHGNYKPTIKDKDGKDVVTPYEKLDENQKKMLSKNDEAKMVLYNALPKKEYERIFMCDTAQNIWDSLITTHQGNKQVKDNKIDLFVQKYEEFSITDDETIDCAFSRFNTIITSLKALDESFSSRNHVRKFLRALPSKWRPKVTAIEESKDLSKLSLDELVGNLKVYEVVLEKDLEIAKNKKEKYKSLALKAKQVLSDDDTSSSDSNDEEYAMAEERREDRRCFKCGDPNHFISDCPKNSSGDQKAFVVGSWSDSGDDSKKEEICLMAHSNEVCQKVKLDPDEWIQDSGCARHMTGNKDLFSSYKPFDGGNVLFGSNTKSKIIGKVSRFNTIITSLKALDESFSSRNHVRKFLRALPSKWRPKVTAIEESKDLSKLSLDELVGNLKVYEVILEKDLEIAKNKKEKYKSLALKAKQVLSDDDTSSSDSNDEEYAMAVRDFKKFFRRRGKFVRQPYDDKKNFRKIKEERREDRRCFKCGDPNHFISDCPKNSSGDQKAFVVGSWSDSGDDSKKEEICLMAHSNEVLSDNLYYSSSSLDNESRENEYDKLGQISLRIINKNKHLDAKNESLKKTINKLKTKLDTLEKGKETSSNCDACNELRLEVNSLKLKLASFENSSSSLQKMVEMQKPSKDKCGLGYTETIASSRNTKIKNLGDQLKKLSVEPACRCHSSTTPACSNEQHRLSDDSAEKKEDLETNVRQKVKLDPDEWIQDSGCTRHMTGNKDLFSSYKPFDGGNVLFGSNTKSKIIGKGTISHNSLTINDVSHVENLSFNLLSIGQICDKKCNVLFSETGSKIIKNGITLGKGIRKNGLYIMKMGNSPKDALCLTSIDDTSTLWHRRLGHANMRLIQSLSSKELVRNLPKLKFEKHFCDACNVGKQVHESHKAKNMVSTSKCLELLHMDLFGPSAVQSYGGNFYTLVIVDDYSRYTWTRFLKHKNEAFDHFEILSKKIQNQKGCPIISIRTDHGREFDNEVQFGAFCDANGITHNFSAPRTPQSNGVVERKNRTLQEMSRTLLNEQSIPQKFWCNAVDTSTYILNRILIRPFLGKTPYELFKGRKPNLEYFKVFGCKCFILNTKDYLTKFDPKSTEGIFLGYSPNSKAYVVLNKETMKVEESLNVKFDKTPPPNSPPLVDDDLLEVGIIENKRKDLEVKENEPLNKQISNIKESKDHPVIGNLNQRTLRSQVQNQSNFFCFVSSVEPKNIKEAIQDESWTMAMQEELTQFKTNDIW
ncbi:retrovirus-related pol polyprotein from transposon TNT 1-94 [Tanacetum coccineum]